MIGSPNDSRNVINLPLWAKAVVLATLGTSFLLCIGVLVRFWGAKDNSDWLLLGVGSIQFTTTALVASVVIFFSQADANIRNLRVRTDNFLTVVLRRALADITFPGMNGPLTVEVTSARDLFGYEFTLKDGPATILRMWCGLNVHRLIVIYHFRNPHEGEAPAAFAATLQEVFRFTFGGAETLQYKLSYEPIPDDDRIVSVWATVGGDRNLLTDPAEKLFWAQDVAMMTESVVGTTLRNRDLVAPSLERPTGPL